MSTDRKPPTFNLILSDAGTQDGPVEVRLRCALKCLLQSFGQTAPQSDSGKTVNVSRYHRSGDCGQDAETDRLIPRDGREHPPVFRRAHAP